jgi:hypothetical protein
MYNVVRVGSKVRTRKMLPLWKIWQRAVHAQLKRRFAAKGDCMIYLASPYSHDDPAVRQARFESACRCAAYLMRAGHHVLSPIAYTHTISEAGGLPVDWTFWERFDRRFITACDKLWVLCIPGWRESSGVTAEIKIARQQGKPVWYVVQKIRGYRAVPQPPKGK